MFTGVKTILKMGAVHSSGISVNIYHTIQCHIPKDSNHHTFLQLKIFSLKEINAIVIRLNTMVE
jgi:hypothetical protein